MSENLKLERTQIDWSKLSTQKVVNASSGMSDPRAPAECLKGQPVEIELEVGYVDVRSVRVLKGQ